MLLSTAIKPRAPRRSGRGATPNAFCEVGGETFTGDAEVGPMVGCLPLSPGQGGPQPLLDQSAQRRSLALGDLPGMREQIIGDLDGRLHMGKPYYRYG